MFCISPVAGGGSIIPAANTLPLGSLCGSFTCLNRPILQGVVTQLGARAISPIIQFCTLPWAVFLAQRPVPGSPSQIPTDASSAQPLLGHFLPSVFVLPSHLHSPATALPEGPTADFPQSALWSEVPPMSYSPTAPCYLPSDIAHGRLGPLPAQVQAVHDRAPKAQGPINAQETLRAGKQNCGGKAQHD